MPLHVLAFTNSELFQLIMPLCNLRYAGILLSFAASIISLLVLTLDRFFSIMRPLHYYSNMTTRRYIISALFVWTVPIALASTLMLLHNQWEDIPRVCDLLLVGKLEFHRFVVALFWIATTAMVTIYIIIFHVARKVAKEEEKMLKPCSSSTQQGPVSRFRKEMKTVRTILIIFCTFYICWLPFVCCVFAQIVNTPLIFDMTLNNTRLLFSFLAMLNSAFNPFVYAFRMPLFKAYLIKTIPCLKNRLLPQNSNMIIPYPLQNGWI